MDLRTGWALVLQLNLWLCGTALLMVAASAVALSIPLRAVGLGLLLPGLLFFFIYVEDRRRVSPEDRTNNPYRTQLVERHRRGLLGSELLALAGYELVVVWHAVTEPHVGVAMVFAAQLPLVVLSLYGAMKHYPALDSIAVAATWSFTILYAIAVTSPLAYSLELLAVAGAWFLLVFAGVESRNVADITGDTDADRPTLAGYLGPTRTRYLEYALKVSGVLVFWAVGSTRVVVIVLTYLLLLRVFRTLSTSTPTRPTLAT